MRQSIVRDARDRAARLGVVRGARGGAVRQGVTRGAHGRAARQVAWPVTVRQATRQVAFGAVLAVPEFRALLAAYTVSVAGDQFARVALSVLVYDRTGSAGLTALTYALTFLPDLVGGPLLAGLADRFPRRRVMIAADLSRTALVALMALPHAPLVLVAGLLVAVQLIGSPGTAARAAIAPQILDSEQYPVGQAMMNTAGQIAQVAGFAGGGALVAALGPGGVLLGDAGTFLFSAVVVWLGVRPHSKPGAGAGQLDAGRRDGAGPPRPEQQRSEAQQQTEAESQSDVARQPEAARPLRANQQATTHQHAKVESQAETEPQVEVGEPPEAEHEAGRRVAARQQTAWWPQLRDGATLVWSDRTLRALIGFACLSGIYIAGEALAAPYAADLRGGPVLVGLLFAGFALGAAAGMLVLARLSVVTRLKALPLLAVGASLPLVGCLLRFDAAVVLTLFTVSGLASGYQVTAATTFMSRVPDRRRGQAFGLAVTAMKVSQGLGVALAGAAGERFAAHQVVGAAGVLGVLVALGLAAFWRSARPPAGGPVPGGPATAQHGQ